MTLFDELIYVAVGKIRQLSRDPLPEEWLSIIAEAKRQSMVGVLFNALSLLPEEQFPPVDIARKWMSFVVGIENKNKLNSQRAAELSAMLLKDGFSSVILKGQGVASYYPCPEARQSGDIDIWVEGGHKKIVSYLKARYPVSNIQIHHADAMIFLDMETEIHFRPSWSYAPWVDRKYRAWYYEQWESQCRSMTGRGYCVTTIGFNLVYLLMHIYRHIFIEGIGLRQLLDYYYVLQSSSEDERIEAKKVIDNLSLGRVASAVMYVLSRIFGLTEDKMICSPDKRRGSLLLAEILEGGNFGKYSSQNVDSCNDSRLIRGAKRSVHNLRLLTYYPEEVICSPFWMLWHWGWKKMNKYI